MLKPKFNKQKRNKAKAIAGEIANMHQLNPFFGIGSIVNEESNLVDIKCSLGEPNKDFTDDRENRVLLYDTYGLSFKFLKIFNKQKKNPVVSFITIKKPFDKKNTGHIYPGLDKIDVQFRMKNSRPAEVKMYDEVWENETGKKMKFTYDKSEKLESIIIF